VFEDVTVNVNGDLFDTAGSGGVVNVPVVNENNAAIGVISAGKVTVTSGDLSLNGTDVDTLLPSDDLALTTTLDNVPVAATYTAGVININSPAGSGIAYVDFTAAQTQNYEIGFKDTGWHFLNGSYNRAKPTNPASYAKLDPADPTCKTLLENNIHGNKRRFTDAAGNAGPFLYDKSTNSGAFNSIAFQDHLHGVWWCSGENLTNAFAAGLSLIESLNVDGIGTGWIPIDQDGVSSLQKENGSATSSLLVDCGMLSASYWTGLTRSALVTQAYRMALSNLSVIAQAKTAANRFIAFKYFT
jgi:hypothetical protein